MKINALANADRIGSVPTIRHFLSTLVDCIGMRPLGEPHIYDVKIEIEKLGKEPFEDEGGVTGVVVLSTSHVAIHTWPAREYLSLDVFSCRDFDPKIVHYYAVFLLGAHEVQAHDLSASTEYRIH